VTFVGDHPSAPPSSLPGAPRPPSSKASSGATGAQSPSSLPGAPRPPSDGAARKHAQQRVLRQIEQMAGRAAAPGPEAPSRAAAEPPRGRSSAPPSVRDSLLRDLASSLRDANRFTSSDRVDKHLRTAREAEQAGDLVGAANALRFAKELCPDRKEIAAEYQRVRAVLAAAQADDFEKQALREERMELWGAAAISWSRVAEGRPNDGAAHRRAAFCLWRSDGDLKRARDLAVRAVELAGADVEARITLGRIYLRAGMKLNARREIEAAAKLDPEDEIVKNLLRELKS
jgi:tetratricopeptide (TPR) repeat protein